MLQIVVVVPLVENPENLIYYITQRETKPKGTIGNKISLLSKVILGNSPSPFRRIYS